MSLTSTTAGRSSTALNGRAAPPPPLRRRISAPWVIGGVAVILTCLLAGAIVGGRLDTRASVLVVTHPVAAGQALTSGDVAVARVSADSSVATMPGAQLTSVVGQTAAVPLRAGELLAPADLGGVAWPPAGQAVIAVAIKPGHAPSSLSAGSHVSAVVVPAAPATGGATPSAIHVTGVVVSIEAAADQSGSQVVSLILSSDDANLLAAATGDVTLVQLGAGG